MIMEALKVGEHVDKWNDDRLDELSGRVDAGFAKVDQEMKAGFAKADQKMEAGFAELRTANERLYRLLFISAISIVVTLIAALAAALTT
jgi:hypothetical protein